MIAAADTLSRAFAVAADIDDHALLYFGYLDRAEVYQKIAEKCDYERTFEPCYEAMELSKADYTEALNLARKLGCDGLARQTEVFLDRLELSCSLIQSQQRFHTGLVQGAIFHPKRPGDVHLDERFTCGS